MVIKRDKRGEYDGSAIIPWIIVILVIVLSVIGYGIYSGKLQAFFQVFKDFFRGGR